MAVTQTFVINSPGSGYVGGRIINEPWRFVATILSYTLTDAAWKIIIYDTDKTVKIGELSSDIGDKVVLSFEFNLVETGCGDFEINLGVDPAADLPFTMAYNQGMEVTG